MAVKPNLFNPFQLSWQPTNPLKPLMRPAPVPTLAPLPGLTPGARRYARAPIPATNKVTYPQTLGGFVPDNTKPSGNPKDPSNGRGTIPPPITPDHPRYTSPGPLNSTTTTPATAPTLPTATTTTETTPVDPNQVWYSLLDQSRMANTARQVPEESKAVWDVLSDKFKKYLSTIPQAFTNRVLEAYGAGRYNDVDAILGEWDMQQQDWWRRAKKQAEWDYKFANRYHTNYSAYVVQRY